MIAWMFGEGQIERIFWARPASPAFVAVAFAAVVVLTIFLYRRRQGLPNRIRVPLAFFRLVALAVVVATAFEPSATITRTFTEKRRVSVLVDVSESMSVKDQRKRSVDVGEAAAALGILPLEGDAKEPGAPA